jgi:hypothetical protein
MRTFSVFDSVAVEQVRVTFKNEDKALNFLPFLDDDLSRLIHAAVESTHNLPHKANVSLGVLDFIIEEVSHLLDLMGHTGFEKFLLQLRRHLLEEGVVVVNVVD